MDKDWEELADFYKKNIKPRSGDIYKIVCAVIEEEDAAKDITQDILLKSWEKLASLKDRTKYWQWVESITGNEIRGYMRKKKTRQKFLSNISFDDMADQLTAASDIMATEADLLEIMVHEEEQMMVMEGLASLDDRDSMIIKMHLVAGMSLKDIASAMEINYGTMRVTYSRALKKLKEAYLRLEKGGCGSEQKQK